MISERFVLEKKNYEFDSQMPILEFIDLSENIT